MSINPKIDIAFKKLFGCEENKDILKAFASKVLPILFNIKTCLLKYVYSLN